MKTFEPTIRTLSIMGFLLLVGVHIAVFVYAVGGTSLAYFLGTITGFFTNIVLSYIQHHLFLKTIEMNQKQDTEAMKNVVGVVMGLTEARLKETRGSITTGHMEALGAPQQPPIRATPYDTDIVDMTNVIR